MALEFEWDPVKAASNADKHGIRFEVAAAIFLDPDRVEFDSNRPDDGESRRKVFGMVDGRPCVVVYTVRGAAIRLISARLAGRRSAAMHRFTLDPNAPPTFTREEKARLDALAPDQVDRAAVSDPDNPPLTEAELRVLDAAAFVRGVRRHTGLSQAGFAERYHIGLARVRDLEQGRSRPDSALTAYLSLIQRRPDIIDLLDEPAGFASVHEDAVLFKHKDRA